MDHASSPDFASLQSLVAGFRPARTVLTAVELDLFTALDGREADAATLASELGCDARAMDLLLCALAGLGLLEASGGRFRNAAVAARHLSRRGPDDRGSVLRHAANLWRRWGRLTECVRTGRPAEEGPRDAAWQRDFILAMHQGKLDGGADVIAALDLRDERRALDLGGGPGTFAVALARAKADLDVVLYDQPDVIEIAREMIPPDLLGGRVTTRGGDFLREDFGRDYDLVFLSSIVHIYGPRDNEALVRRIYDATSDHGRIVVRDHFLDPDGTRPVAAALFSLNMLVNTPAGRAYTEGEIAAWLAGAGYYSIRRVDPGGDSSLLIARR